MAGRVRIPDLYIPRRSRYSELFSLYQTGVQAQLDVTGTVCLRLGDLGGVGVVVERNAQMTFLTAVVGQAKRESPVKRECPLFARAQTLPGAAWLAAAPLHIPPHDL